MNAPAHRFRIRWWHIAITIVLIAVLALWVYGLSSRASGRAAFLAQVAARQAAGQPATVDDYVARAPAVDTQAQQDWDVWSKAAQSAWKDPAYDKKAWDAWIVGQGERPESIVASLAAQRASMEPALGLLRRGDLVLSGYGWAAADLPPGKRTLLHTSALRLPSLLSMRALADWLHYSAVITEDPRPVLADLDALHAALQRQPGTLIDAMITVAIDAIRDRTYVDLALRGTLPDDLRDRWLTEPNRLLALVAEGFDGEASLFGGGIYNLVADAGPWSATMDPDARLASRLFGGPIFWATGLGDAAVIIEFNAAIADRLRGTSSTPLPDWSTIAPRLGPIGKLAIPNFYESARHALEADARQRLARTAVRLLAMGRDAGLPADQAALTAALGNVSLAPAGDHLALRYERLSDSRFRVAVDPSSPAPNFDDPSRMAGRGAKLGTPAASEPLVWGGTVIELPVPAR